MKTIDVKAARARGVAAAKQLWAQHLYSPQVTHAQRLALKVTDVQWSERGLPENTFAFDAWREALGAANGELARQVSLYKDVVRSAKLSKWGRRAAYFGLTFLLGVGGSVLTIFAARALGLIR